MNIKHYILVKGKIKEVGFIEWAKWFESPTTNRIIGSTMVKNIRVSTVFLGLNHSFSGGKKPVLFETMMFNQRTKTIVIKSKITKVKLGIKNPALNHYQVRYCTLKEAIAGHKYAVKFAKAMLK